MKSHTHETASTISRLRVLTALLVAPLFACNRATDPFADCGNLSGFSESGVGCFNMQTASLGEVYAVTLDGSGPSVPLKAYLATGGGDAGASSAPTNCATVVAEAIVSQPEPAQNYKLSPNTFSAGGAFRTPTVAAQVAADVSSSFTISTGPQTKTTIQDPTNLLACSPDAAQTMNQYLASLSPGQRANTGFFIVNQVIDTAISVTANNGASFSGQGSYCDESANLTVSVSCQEFDQLSENEAGSAPVFFDGNTYVSDSDGGLTWAAVQVPCNGLLAH